MAVDQLLPDSRTGTPVLESLGGRLQGGADHIQRPARILLRCNGFCHHAEQLVLPAEEHLALVGEMAEERPLRQAGAFSDLRHRRLVEAAFGVQRQGRLLEATLSIRLPAAHGGNTTGMTAAVISITVDDSY
ncbi:hypothetical protein AU194_19250 [Mycobacterium sp. GA-2829]|nr:hypothetical protein AU194_19250 [Mycobacterium sp. GA-2829]